MGHEDQKKLAKRPKICQGKAKPAAQDKAPNKTKMRHTGEKPGSHHSGHHGQTVVTTTARGGSHSQAVVSPTAVVEPFPPVVRFFPSRASSSSGGFCYFLSLYCTYLDIQGTYLTP